MRLQIVTLLKVIKTNLQVLENYLHCGTRMTNACCNLQFILQNKIIYKTTAELQSVNKSYVELIK